MAATVSATTEFDDISQNNDAATISWAETCGNTPLDLEAKVDGAYSAPPPVETARNDDDKAGDNDKADDAEGWSTVNKKKAERNTDAKYNGKNFTDGSANNGARPGNSRRRQFRKNNPEFSKERRSRKPAPAASKEASAETPAPTEGANVEAPVAITNGISGDSGGESGDSVDKEKEIAEKKKEYVAAPVPTTNPWQKDIDKTATAAATAVTKPVAAAAAPADNTASVKKPLEGKTSSDSNASSKKQAAVSKNKKSAKKAAPQPAATSVGNSLPSSCSWAKPGSKAQEPTPTAAATTTELNQTESKSADNGNDANGTLFDLSCYFCYHSIRLICA